MNDDAHVLTMGQIDFIRSAIFELVKASEQRLEAVKEFIDDKKALKLARARVQDDRKWAEEIENLLFPSKHIVIYYYRFPAFDQR